VLLIKEYWAYIDLYCNYVTKVHWFDPGFRQQMLEIRNKTQWTTPTYFTTTFRYRYKG